jgi:putative ATP-binding cassette transporter
MNEFGRQAWSRFVTLAKPVLRSEVRWKVLGLFAVLLTLILSANGLNLCNSYVLRDFGTAIEERQAAQFSYLALVYAGVFAVSTVVAAFSRFVEERLGLVWRRWLTRHLAQRYLAGQAYYRLNSRGDIDNPDQRITEDAKAFTTHTLSLILILLNSTIAFVSFAGVLWLITPWLFLTAVVYAVFGTLLTIGLGRRLVGMDVLQLKKEADFRYALIRVRENAERIALLRGEGTEGRRLDRRLDALADNWKGMIKVNRNLGFFTNGYNYMIQLIPALIVAPLYFRGEIPFGTVGQAAMAFSTLMNSFSIIVKEFDRITQFAAVVRRLGTFWEAVEKTQEPAPQGIDVAEDDTRVAYEGLTLLTPKDRRLLIKDLSLEVPRGRRLLITGPQGVGRSSVLRATAGLWASGEGRIVRPSLDEILFLPQQPYLVPGSLRDQLLYANRKDGLTDEQLLAVLKQVQMDPVLDRVDGLDAERDWPAFLSRGEQQQLAFARLLLANPRFAFLDEATCALDPSRGRYLYDLLSRSSITYISVGSDPGLADYHDMLLELRGGGAWGMVPRVCAASA